MRGIAGFGHDLVSYTDGLLWLSQELPLVIEVVESDEKIEQILHRLNKLITGGMITLEKAQVIFYRK